MFMFYHLVSALINTYNNNKNRINSIANINNKRTTTSNANDENLGGPIIFSTQILWMRWLFRCLAQHRLTQFLKRFISISWTRMKFYRTLVQIRIEMKMRIIRFVSIFIYQDTVWMERSPGQFDVHFLYLCYYYSLTGQERKNAQCHSRI